MASEKAYSVIEYYADHSGYRCGYCKSSNTNYSHGMWAHRMTVQDYQNLIDRGWRRSGLYCYKPTLNVTCCPMYTIKCEALNFRPSKSQKKVLKRMHQYLYHSSEKCDSANAGSSKSPENIDTNSIREIPDLESKIINTKQSEADVEILSVDPSVSSFKEQEDETDGVSPSKKSHNADGPSNSTSPEKQEKYVRPGSGMDVLRPPCKKAKLARIERKHQKLLNKGFTEEEVHQMMKKNSVPIDAKSLEDILNEPLPSDPVHRLEVRLVRSYPASCEFERTFEEAFSVYRKYQMAIHNDPPDRCSQRQYTRFLVNSPLQVKLVPVKSEEFKRTLQTSWSVFVKYQAHVHNESEEEWGIYSYHEFLVDTPLMPWKPSDGPPQGYGSFHQQYWLDGQLIAVGVIDILPRCVSSVYFYYDPDFSHLSLGTYASLRELALTRSLHRHASNLKFYYMGFYIHTCQKMRYKANYSPSYLLCPETYDWFPVNECKKKLEVNRYCRFNEDPSATDKDGQMNINEVLVLFHHSAMAYSMYRNMNPNCEDSEEVKQYSQLVGKKCAKRMLLIRT